MYVLFKITIYKHICILDEGGLKKSELVNWYLKENEGEIETMEQLTEMKTILEKVIDRLAHHVSTCMCATLQWNKTNPVTYGTLCIWLHNE